MCLHATAQEGTGQRHNHIDGGFRNYRNDYDNDRAKPEGTDITGSLLDCIYHFWERLVVAALQMERFNMGMHCA